MKKLLSPLAIALAISGVTAYHLIEFNHGLTVLSEYQQNAKR